MTNKINNPNIHEVLRFHELLSQEFNSEVLSENSSGNKWEYLKWLFYRFGNLSIDINDKHQLDTFKVKGWTDFSILQTNEINAMAIKHKNLRFIVFNLGLLYLIKDTFNVLMGMKAFLPSIGDSSQEDVSVNDFKLNLEANWNNRIRMRYNPKCPIRQESSNQITFLALWFVYMHELTHLKHCHTDFFESQYGVKYFSEFPFEKMTSEQYFDKKAFELDADSEAGTFTIQVANLFKDFFKPYDPYYIWCIMIQVLFKILNPRANYKEEHNQTHPNHLLRIINLYDVSLGFLSETKTDIKEADIRSFQKKAFSVLDIFHEAGFKSKRMDTIENQYKYLYSYSQRLDSLVTNELKGLIELSNLQIQKEYDSIL